MTFELIDLRPGPSDESWWQPPFDYGVVYEHPHWWQRQLGDDPWFVQVRENGVEVARMELDEDVEIEQYANVPVVGPEGLEIAFIEVATAARGRGIGTRGVRGLAGRHPHRRLFAYSEEADGFWASLGWQPFDDLGSDQTQRTLFIQPAR